MTPDQVQLVCMALAHMAVERPGWYEMTRTFATTLDDHAGPLFDRFYLLHLAPAPSREHDSIMQLRRVVETANPLLWAMVQEIAWPKS